MGMWLELGIFVVVLIWGVWQVRDVKRAQAKTRAEKAQQQANSVGGDASEWQSPPKQ